jgi:5-methylcytosine-specific restriction endonuclease McrA
MDDDHRAVDRRPTNRRGKKATTRMNSRTKQRKVRAMKIRDGNKCHWCKREFTEELPATVDHMKALKDGGSDAIENLVLACSPCNNGRANPPLGRRRTKDD